MKKLGIIFMVVALIAAFTLVTCASGGAGPKQSTASTPAEEPPPPGTERLFLSNAALAIYKFELPAGQTWGNYNRLTAEYLVDEENIVKSLRTGAVRLYGNYRPEDFIPDSGNTVVSLSTDPMFAHKIIHQQIASWAQIGAVANQWFTYTYDITGGRAHGQFNRKNIPAASETGPFYFALGLTSQDEGRRNGITQLVRNITLHHATNAALNVVSTGSGFEGSSSAAYYINNCRRVSGGPAQ